MEDIHDHRQVGRRDQQRALAARAVEVAMPGVERNREQAFRAPFEGSLGAVREFDLRRAGAFEHVDHVFVKVLLGQRRLARPDVEDEHVGEVAASLQMDSCTLYAITRPRLRLDRKQVDAVMFGDGNALAGDPFEIGIDAIARLFVRHRFLPENGGPGAGAAAAGCLAFFKRTAAI